MTWRRPLLFLGALLLSEAIGLEIGFRNELFLWLFVVVIPLVLAAIWLKLALQESKRSSTTPPKMT